jgi:hypothetical protein
MTFEQFKQTAEEIVARLNAQKNDTRTEFLYLLLNPILNGSAQFHFSYPVKSKEGYFELGLEKGGFKKEKCSSKVERTIQELTQYTRYGLLAIDDLAEWEEKALFLLEKVLLLYSEKALHPKVAKALFETVNEAMTASALN